jgi:hypothetical protein
MINRSAFIDGLPEALQLSVYPAFVGDLEKKETMKWLHYPGGSAKTHQYCQCARPKSSVMAVRPFDFAQDNRRRQVQVNRVVATAYRASGSCPGALISKCSITNTAAPINSA